MEWNKIPNFNDYTLFLQEQGHTNFNPLQIKKDSYEEPIRKVSKSAQKIIDQNIKKRDELIYKEDDDCFNNSKKFLSKNWNLNTLKSLLQSFKLDEFKYKLMYDILEDLIDKNKITDKLYHIFYFLKLNDNKFARKEVLAKAETLLRKSSDIIKIQMTVLSPFLYPLNFFNFEKQTLDPWQKEVFEMIDKKENILIVARTSAGKTVCSTYAVVSSKRTLFVVPSDELARQVAGVLRNLLGGHVALLTNKDNFFENNHYKVLVGTPLKVEEYIIENSFTFDYLICDEIHQIRDIEHEGNAYERIIMMLAENTQLLMMSATISNPDVLISWIEELKGQGVKLVKHNKRFITQQRHLWNGTQLLCLHPFSTITTKDLENQTIDENLIMTGLDLYDAYEKAQLVFSSSVIDLLNPSNFFKKVILTQDDIKEYEEHFKTTLFNLVHTNRTETENFLKMFVVLVDKREPNFFGLIKELYAKNMTPAIIFKQTSAKATECAQDIIKELEIKEKELYPNYQSDLLLLQEYYDKYREDIKKIDNVNVDKISDSKNTKNKFDMQSYKYNTEKRLLDKNLNAMKDKFSTLYASRLHKNPERKEEYEKELNKILRMDSFTGIDIYRPHPELTFTTTITSDKMRKLKNRLRENLEQNLGYEHIFLRGIERGIVSYNCNMQTPFQREVQSLINQKEISFIIADDSLAYGVNMPIKSVVIMGNGDDWDTVKATQMIGRSGRRGIDREGHTIFYNCNWGDIIKAKKLDMTGCNQSSYFDLLPYHFTENKSLLNRLLQKHTFTEWKDEMLVNPESRLDEYKMMVSTIRKEKQKLIWKLRFLGENAYKLITKFDGVDTNISYEDLFIIIYEQIFPKNEEIYRSIREQRILDTEHVTYLRLIGNILIILNGDAKNLQVKKVTNTLFNVIKTLIIKSQF